MGPYPAGSSNPISFTFLLTVSYANPRSPMTKTMICVDSSNILWVNACFVENRFWTSGKGMPMLCYEPAPQVMYLQFKNTVTEATVKKLMP